MVSKNLENRSVFYAITRIETVAKYSSVMVALRRFTDTELLWQHAKISLIVTIWQQGGPLWPV